MMEEVSNLTERTPFEGAGLGRPMKQANRKVKQKKRSETDPNSAQTSTNSAVAGEDGKMDEEDTTELGKRAAVEGLTRDEEQREDQFGEETKEPVNMETGSSEIPSPNQVNETMINDELEATFDDDVEMEIMQGQPIWAKAWNIKIDNEIYELTPHNWKELEKEFQKADVNEADLIRIEESMQFRVGIRIDQCLKGNTPKGPANVYWGLLQAWWLIQGYDLNMAITWADFKIQGVREDVVKCLKQIAEENNNVKEMFSAEAKKIEEYQEETLEFGEMQGFANLVPAIGAKKIAWFKEIDNRAILSSLRGKEKWGYKLDEALLAIQSVKLCDGGGQYFCMGGFNQIKNVTKAAVIQQLREWQRQYKQWKIPSRFGIGRTRRELDMLCREEERVVSWMLIANIPAGFKSAPNEWKKDMKAALEIGNMPHYQFSIASEKLSEGMKRIIEPTEYSEVFGILVELDEEIEIGGGKMATHFEIRGPRRKAVKGERFNKKDAEVVTKYLCHMLSVTEAKGLINARVQCVFRGCTWDPPFNNLIRHIVARYVAVEKRLSDRLSVVQHLRHQLYDVTKREKVWKDEWVIIVYALSTVKLAEVKTGHEILGCQGDRSVEVNYAGLSLEMAKSVAAIQGRLPKAFISKPMQYLTLAGVRTDLTHEEIMDVLVTLLGVDNIKYWLVRRVFRKAFSTVIICVDGADEPILDRTTAAKLVDVTKVGWSSIQTNFPFRGDIGYENEVIEIDTSKVRVRSEDVHQGQSTLQTNGFKKSYREATRSSSGGETEGLSEESSLATHGNSSNGQMTNAMAMIQQMTAGLQKQMIQVTSRLAVIEDEQKAKEKQTAQRFQILTQKYDQLENQTKTSLNEAMAMVKLEVRDVMYEVLAQHSFRVRGQASAEERGHEDGAAGGQQNG
jgi:hypothetical protein